MKEFKPLYNNEGKVANPEIAAVMAEQEKYMRDDRSRGIVDKTQDEIDLATHETGEQKRYELILKNIASKIREALSSEEIELIRKIEENDDMGNMEMIMREIAKK